MTYTAKQLEDIGTRYDHLIDLIELCADGVEVLQGYTYNTPMDSAKRAKLQNTIEITRNILDSMSGYDQYDYLTRKSVNSIPKAEDIRGGRGTPLKVTKLLPRPNDKHNLTGRE